MRGKAPPVEGATASAEKWWREEAGELAGQRRSWEWSSSEGRQEAQGQGFAGGEEEETSLSRGLHLAGSGLPPS